MLFNVRSISHGSNRIASTGLLLIALASGSTTFAAGSMGTGSTLKGTVTVNSASASAIKPGGALFVIARSAAQPSGAPLAVLRIPNPKFPQSFEISERNVMMPGTVFKGPFKLVARFSPNGDALDKSGPESATPAKETYELGAQDIKIEIKSQSK